MKKKKIEPDWSTVLSPKEMEERFGHYFPVEKEDKIYISSDYLAERSLEALGKNIPNIDYLIDVIRHTYWAIRKETEEVEKKKHKNIKIKKLSTFEKLRLEKERKESIL